MTTFKVEFYGSDDLLSDVSDDFNSVGAATKEARQRLRDGDYASAIVVKETQVYELTATTKTVTTIKSQAI